MDPFRAPGISIETLPGMPPPWPAIVRAYLVETYLRGGSKRTALEYARILSRFLADVPDPGRVDPLVVRAFAFRPVDAATPPAASTVGVRLAAIGGLYRVAEQSGLVARNPAAGIRRPRPSSPPPRGVAVEDLRRLLSAMPVDQAGMRDRAIVILIAMTGLRRSEALGLRLGDVDLDTRTLVVRVKGGATRLLVVPPPAADAIQRWLACPGSERQGQADASVFGIGPAGFYASLRLRAAAAGIAGCTPHALRHSAAAIRRQAGASLEDISRLLGHASLATTARYLRRVEPEQDDGWLPVAAALGIGGSDRSIRLSRSATRTRAGPTGQRTTGRVVAHPSGQSSRRAFEWQTPTTAALYPDRHRSRASRRNGHDGPPSHT